MVNNEDDNVKNWADHDKHFFILSSAGKPIWARYGDESQLSTLMGVIQAIISFFQDSDDTIKSIQAQQHQIVFIIKGPLYYVAVSRTGESATQLRDQLLFLHNQILSVLTNAQLTKIFEQRVNFDLRRLLGGTEVFLESLSDLFSKDHSFMLSGLQCLRLSKTVREQIGQVLATGRVKNILYGMIVCKGQLVTLLRPKRHSLHPSDLHLLFNMLTGSTTFHHTAESWTPICLPKFNAKGFLHAYICYIEKDVSIVVISTDKNNFFEISDWKTKMVEKLISSQPLIQQTQHKRQEIESQQQQQTQQQSTLPPSSLLSQLKMESSYTVADTEIPYLLHFLYKSKTYIQFTTPTLQQLENQHLDKLDEINTYYFKLYQLVYDRMHHRSRPLKLYYFHSKKETVLGWVKTKNKKYVTVYSLCTVAN
ncbi:vacuolar fusion protein MON1 [Mycotypha africana]|uniref:vacuolar fusion protein MON1 n=1 Tax=Mycotypha africana TaxID=64632 RepID=UPI0023003049|nr:vacuolar fusion protein MON1 [Mycotypha africana]KAI8975580.1 vacuolar fusion protein MON1 [Mycotypha africana]